jgi:hypothetical protein
MLLAVVYAITGIRWQEGPTLPWSRYGDFVRRLHLDPQLGKSEDYRYQAFRRRWGKSYWWINFYQVFMLQGLLLWVIAMSLMAAGQRQASAGSHPGCHRRRCLVCGFLRGGGRLATGPLPSTPRTRAK